MGKELRMSMLILYITLKNCVAFYDKLAYNTEWDRITDTQCWQRNYNLVFNGENLSNAITHAPNIYIKEGYEIYEA